jgi:molybdenum cofactor cytidylyltransferase
VISGVVLAAGSSTRMGRQKLTLPLGGRGILSRVLATSVASPVDEVIVVLGPGADDVRAALGEVPARVRFVSNPDHLEGQSTSLRVGLRACDPAAGAAVVLLGDQPGVSVAAIASVVTTFTGSAGDPGHDVVQASYGGRPAHPTVLARIVWDEVVGEGDAGARAWIAAHPDRRTLVEVGGAPPPDVDTPGEYERLRQAFEED